MTVSEYNKYDILFAGVRLRHCKVAKRSKATILNIAVLKYLCKKILGISYGDQSVFSI